MSVALASALVTVAAPAAAPTEDRAAAARAAYDEGRAAFDAGDYERALERVQAAYRLSPEAVYLYNIGRALESLGRLREAYDAFLRVRLLPKATEQAREMASSKLRDLETLRSRAVVRLARLQPGELAQIDDQLALETARDRDLDPGTHQLCVLSADKTALSCWRRDLDAGLRVPWPPSSGGDTRATLRWSALAGVQSVSLDDHVLLVDLERLERLSVDAGVRAVRVVSARDREPVVLRVEALPGTEHDLAARVQVEWNLQLERRQATSAGPGAWPWVVVGVGALSAAVGAGLLIAAEADRDTVRDADQAPDGTVVGITQRDAFDRWDSADRNTTVGAVLTGSGAAVLTAGLLWGLLAGDDGASR